MRRAWIGSRRALPKQEFRIVIATVRVGVAMSLLQRHQAWDFGLSYIGRGEA
jgi:hypothetical protein